ACNSGIALCSLMTVICVLELFENILFLHDAYAVEASQSQRVLSFHQEFWFNGLSCVGDARGIRAAHYPSNRFWKLDTGLLCHLIVSYDVDRRARRDQGNLIHFTRFELAIFHFDNILLASRFR